MKGSSPARSMMKMRCSIERNLGTTADGFGQKDGSWRAIAGAVPCHVWAGSSGGKHTSAGETRTITTDLPGAILPMGTDVTPQDRLGIVTDKQGRQLFGLMYVDAVLPRITHLELRLRNIDG
jgi:hypothetical protein